MKTLKHFIPLLAAAMTIVGVSSCTKDNEETTRFSVRMTDNPYNATAVNVEIKEVKANYTNDSTKWVSFMTHAGVYNLLELQNGVDTLLAEAVIPTGTIKEIRFVLGTDNSIVIGGVTYPLTIPSGSESGLKIKLNKKLNASIDSVLIDFDAGLSIHLEGTGDYKLKPVLKVKP
ncbi:DUF4382 domain-containing protein [Ferruginibacter sp. SUN002]|uniref:DUF4382 domain-containing protein n=1 Tax=Ferruginibacter sp. SUN002 TaxID=2937789 RepID=UPI003D36703E